MINYTPILAKLREARNIQQNKMLKNRDRSQYSRIETGKTDLKLKTLEKICEKLGITINEFVSLSSSDNSIDSMVLEFRDCCRNIDNLEKKENFLEKFSNLTSKKKTELTRIEYNFIHSVRSILSSYWKEIKPLNEQEINNIHSHLINTNFYAQFDYMLALNVSKHFNKTQMIDIIDRMFPLEMFEKRNDLTKQYSNLLVTNVITFFIYEQDYQLALKYTEKAQKELDLSDSYYLHLNLLYLKYLALSFIENHTKYIEKTRNIIRIIHDIGDINSAKKLEDELDTLNRMPDFYKKTGQVIEMPAST